MNIYQLPQDVINQLVETFKATGIIYENGTDTNDLNNIEDLAEFYNSEVNYILEVIKEELLHKQEALDNIIVKSEDITREAYFACQSSKKPEMWAKVE